MDKRRTIYKLGDLKTCIFLTLLNLVSGALLLGLLKVFPGIVKAKLEERLLSVMEGGMSEKLEAVKDVLGDSFYYYHSASLEAILISVVALTSMLLLIRLNGQLKFRKMIAWSITVGISFVNLASVAFAYRFMNFGSTTLANQGVRLIMVLGFTFFLVGLIVLFFKTLRDLTQPKSVL